MLQDEAKLLLQRAECRFVNNIRLPGMYHMAFLRSTHARLLSVDVGKVAGLLGVAKVLTGNDDAVSYRDGDIHEFAAMPPRVLKGLGVLPAGEGR